jgi:Rrf2 family protein
MLRIPARVDYAIRALGELARAGASTERPLKGDIIATNQQVSLGFVETTLNTMRRAGLVDSRRGNEGGYWLSRPPEEITLAEVLRALEGRILDYAVIPGAAADDATVQATKQIWRHADVVLSTLLEAVTVAQIAEGTLRLPADGRDGRDGRPPSGSPTPSAAS